MATGIIGASSGGTVSYTAPLDAKIIVSISCPVSGQSAAITLNGVNAVALYNNTYSTNYSFSHFVGAGQTVMISASSGAYCIVSVLEGT